MTDITKSSTDPSTSSSSSRPAAAASNDVVVGLNKDLLEIKKHLFAESRNLQVITICGMGGIGKTTLARSVYHDPSIQALFDIGGWVTVSQSYSVEGILSTLRQSLKPFHAKRVEESHGSREEDVHEEGKADFSEESNEYAAEMSEEDNGNAFSDGETSEPPGEVFEQGPDSTGTQVFKTLKKRKYLIVMDDIWDTTVCDALYTIFPDDENGSRVILTTRQQDVATYGENCSPHTMQLMHAGTSWDLLRQKVFADGVCNCELEDVGRSIARSCGGLPLAVVVIAGLLSTVERARASWEEVAERVKSAVATEDEQFEKILSLSYTDLPRHLKQCFVYMGGFPEDHEIHVAKLYKLWIAQGFFEVFVSASKSLEEEAEGCLQDLINKNLVFVGARKPHGEIKSCSLHDVMRDLCKKKADDDKFPLYDETLGESFRLGTLEDAKDLRVVEQGRVWEGSYVPPFLFGLASLRYLVLDCSVELPAAVSNLENLQTLIVNPNRGLVCLPPEIWRMQQLRHLISFFDQLPCPQGATSFPLGNLQTLSQVNNLECTYRFVKMVPNVKKLGILYSGMYELEASCMANDFHDFHLENLRHLHRLEKLKVWVYLGFRGMLNPVFPQSLKNLSLRGWILPSWKDMKIVGSLPNLQVLKLRYLWGKDDVWETNEDEFANLSFLLIERSDLREWITESGHFPKLKKLLLHYCGRLDDIPLEVGDFPSLELIEVKEGTKLLVESARCLENYQKSNGNHSLQVFCY